MRLLSIELSGFRGFAQKREFDLDADAVVVMGTNGHGKTSLFDGILFALTGKVPRLGSDVASLVSMYSDTGQARATLRFKDHNDGRAFAVTRTSDGAETRITFETPDGLYQGPSAEGMLMDLIWPEAAVASDPNVALAYVLTQSVYLQQDIVRHFIDAATPQECFVAVGELLGAGRVTEFQSSLERSKKAWTTATNQRQQELRSTLERLAMLDGRIADLTSRTSDISKQPISIEDWNKWWEDLAEIGLKSARVDLTSREAPTAINSAIKQLDAQRLITERQSQTLNSLLADIRGLAKQSQLDVNPLRDKVAKLQSEIEELKRNTEEEQSRLADRRRHQAELKEKSEQLKALAALALQNLGDHCPICAQTYDRGSTRARLERLATTGLEDVGIDSTSSTLNKMLSALSSKENELSSAELSLRTANQALTAQQIAEQGITKRLSEFEIAADGNRELAIEQAVEVGKTLIEYLSNLQKIGEFFALGLAQSSTVAGVEELQREASALRNDVEVRQKSIAARTRTGDLAQNVIEALREAVSRVVEERLKSINPLIQNIWTRIDPHPAFRVVRLLSEVFKGKGQLSTVISDPINDKTSASPGTVLSSSQVNALGVSVFLALNLGSPRPPLPIAILDDPLQSLDDINLLGLVDLLRRTKDSRQLLVSTHDSRFGDLLARKLRPADGSGRTLVIELEGWARIGPRVRIREVNPDPVPLRLVS